ncbi:type II toxin-antitoxin system VapC family toxin [Ornithinimicrobium faecis]|uniref:type II toxin-antitoxin system VapC family toxin n=1 Tax=Ornithinimicrobium faecis TaxID=2934158 RepID=UPI0021192EFB|nr:PIN domain nuclease [Ornithinimicrobium sp. HY1745]
MIVDTSVWIEFLRPSPSGAGDRLESLIRDRERLVIPEVVLMELLSGTTDEALAERRRRLIESFELTPTEPILDSLSAASLQRMCRRGGESVRNLGDCLIASVALRLDLPVMHRDRDFEVLRRHCGIRTVSLIGA